MGLIDEARHYRSGKSTVCRVADLIDKTELTQAELEEALVDEDLETTAIQKALRDRYGDSAPSYSTLRRHRSRECRCHESR